MHDAATEKDLPVCENGRGGGAAMKSLRGFLEKSFTPHGAGLRAVLRAAQTVKKASQTLQLLAALLP